MPALLTRLEPFDFQRADIDFLHSEGDTGLVIAEVGAGKTLIGVTVGLESEAEVILVIAPAGVLDNEWEARIRAQDPDAIVRQIRDDRDALDDLMIGLPGWYLISHQLFTRTEGWAAIRPDLTIVDEIHLLANRKSKGGEKLRRELRSHRRIGMSGTPWRNKFENAWNILRWVYPTHSMPYDIADVSNARWVSQWCETKKDIFDPTGIEVVGEKEPGALANAIPCYIQHFKREQCCEFHPEGFLDLEAPETRTEIVELTAQQWGLLEQMDLDYVAYLQQQRQGVIDHTAEKAMLIAKLPIVARTRRRQMTLGVPSIETVEKPVWLREDGKITYPKIQIGVEHEEQISFAFDCESPKLDRAIERLLEEGDRPCIMLMSSRKFAQVVVHRLTELGISAVEFSGEIPQKQRLAIRDSFGRGEIRVIVAVTEAISTGIDGLQFACSWLLCLERTDDLASWTQVIGRVDRRGQTEQVLVEEIVALGSMDFGIIDKQVQRELSLNRSLRRKLRKAGVRLAA